MTMAERAQTGSVTDTKEEKETREPAVEDQEAQDADTDGGSQKATQQEETKRILSVGWILGCPNLP